MRAGIGIAALSIAVAWIGTPRLAALILAGIGGITAATAIYKERHP